MLTPPTIVIPKLPRKATNTYMKTEVSSSMLSSSVDVVDHIEVVVIEEVDSVGFVDLVGM